CCRRRRGGACIFGHEQSGVSFSRSGEGENGQKSNDCLNGINIFLIFGIPNAESGGTGRRAELCIAGNRASGSDAGTDGSGGRKE
ncbi:MAG: hypothetical protein KA780_06900, partial [Prolixibacteraceae bacterium]|nr:hypothetical protein [Prolixibacteraceae bacterium]